VTATEHLRTEHDLLERILAVLEVAGAHLPARPSLAPPPLDGVLDLLTHFIARCHRDKEDALLAALAARGVTPEGAPGESRCSEHVETWRHLRKLGGAVDPAILLRSQVAFLREHLHWDRTVLIARAEETLGSDDQQKLGDLFAQIDGREFGGPAADVLRPLAASLEAASGAAGSPAPVGEPTEARAADVMRPGSAAVSPRDSLARAAETMEALGVRELPVIEAGRVVGILSVTDLAPHRGHFEWTAVRTAMSIDPVTVTPDTPVAAVAGLLLERCFNAVPVVATGTHALLGMLSRNDLLRLLL
jgi:CBS domain-containing protein